MSSLWSSLTISFCCFCLKKGTSLNSGLQQSIDPACRQPDIEISDLWLKTIQEVN